MDRSVIRREILPFALQINEQCQQCHAGERWKPATFEHSPDRIRAEHAEEGVTASLDACVGCHRGGDEGEESREGDDD